RKRPDRLRRRRHSWNRSPRSVEVGGEAPRTPLRLLRRQAVAEATRSERLPRNGQALMALGAVSSDGGGRRAERTDHLRAVGLHVTLPQRLQELLVERIPAQPAHEEDRETECDEASHHCGTGDQHMPWQRQLTDE